MKKLNLTILIIIIALIVTTIVVSQVITTIKGVVLKKEVFSGDPSYLGQLTIKDEDGNEIIIKVTPGTKICDKDGKPIEEGFCSIKEGQIVVIGYIEVGEGEKKENLAVQITSFPPIPFKGTAVAKRPKIPFDPNDPYNLGEIDVDVSPPKAKPKDRIVITLRVIGFTFVFNKNGLPIVFCEIAVGDALEGTYHEEAVPAGVRYADSISDLSSPRVGTTLEFEGTVTNLKNTKKDEIRVVGEGGIVKTFKVTETTAFFDKRSNCISFSDIKNGHNVKVVYSEGEDKGGHKVLTATSIQDNSFPPE